jgi:hypothetical protein
MNAPKDTQVGAERCPCSLAGVAVDFAAAIPIIIPCPLVHAVADGGMRRMAATITLPFVGIEQGAAWGHVVGNESVAGLPIRMVTDPQALLARVARDDADNGGTIVRIGAVSLALIGASTGWIGGIAMGRTFFPPRSDTIHRPQRRCRASRRLAPSRSGWPGCAVGGYGAVSVIPPTRARGGPSARPW